MRARSVLKLSLGLAALACSKAEPSAPAGSASSRPAPSVAPAGVGSATPTTAQHQAPATTVSLDGQLHSPPAATGRRVYARSLKAWIYERPSRSAARMGSWLSADGEVGASYAQQVWLRGAAPPDARAAWEGKRSDPLPTFLAAGRALPTPEGQANHGAELLAARMKPRQGLSLLTT